MTVKNTKEIKEEVSKEPTKTRWDIPDLEAYGIEAETKEEAYKIALKTKDKNK